MENAIAVHILTAQGKGGKELIVFFTFVFSRPGYYCRVLFTGHERDTMQQISATRA